jgi:hypothetical protein
MYQIYAELNNIRRIDKIITQVAQYSVTNLFVPYMLCDIENLEHK